MLVQLDNILLPYPTIQALYPPTHTPRASFWGWSMAACVSWRKAAEVTNLRRERHTLLAEQIPLSCLRSWKFIKRYHVTYIWGTRVGPLTGDAGAELWVRKCAYRHQDKSVRRRLWTLIPIEGATVGLGDQTLPSSDSGSAESHKEHASGWTLPEFQCCGQDGANQDEDIIETREHQDWDFRHSQSTVWTVIWTHLITVGIAVTHLRGHGVWTNGVMEETTV